jgi:PAS domain-containing protein
MSTDDPSLLRRQLERERAARKQAEELLEEKRSELTLANRRLSERELAKTPIAASREVLLKIIDTVPARVFWKDSDLRFLGCNTAFRQRCRDAKS